MLCEATISDAERNRVIERIAVRSSWSTCAPLLDWFPVRLHEFRDAESRTESKELNTEMRLGVSDLSGDVCTHWFAESVWENEGGSVRNLPDQRRACQAHRTSRRRRSAAVGLLLEGTMYA